MISSLKILRLVLIIKIEKLSYIAEKKTIYFLNMKNKTVKMVIYMIFINRKMFCSISRYQKYLNAILR